MGAISGPYWVQGPGGGGASWENIGFRHFKGNFFLNSNTYPPNMARNTLRKYWLSFDSHLLSDFIMPPP